MSDSCACHESVSVRLIELVRRVIERDEDSFFCYYRGEAYDLFFFLSQIFPLKSDDQLLDIFYRFMKMDYDFTISSKIAWPRFCDTIIKSDVSDSDSVLNLLVKLMRLPGELSLVSVARCGQS